MRRLQRNRLVTAVLAVALVLTVCSVASACPGCKAALEQNDPTHGGMVKGYFYSILFMMGMPYMLLGLFCGSMYYKVRRARVGSEGTQPKGQVSPAGESAPTASDEPLS